MSVTMLPMMTVGLAVVPFFVIYLLGRAGRSGPDRDPMLGAKVAVHLIVTVCFQLVLAGAALLLVATTNRHMGFLTDTAAGLLVGALVAGIVPAVLLFTIAKRDGGVDVGRQALGVNAITTGLATVTALVSMFVMAFNGGEVTQVLMLVLVYVPAFIACLILVALRAREEAQARGAGGYGPPPAGYQPPPAGYQPPPAGYQPPPAGY